ncbi:UNVERIFIED_CONTAM: hypothetical protein K2H54_008184 [Gekko kuhli]
MGSSSFFFFSIYLASTTRGRRLTRPHGRGLLLYVAWEREEVFEIRQLRAHLAQQDLDLAAEREAALQVPHMLNKQSSNRYKVVAAAGDSDDEATENITELRPPRGEQRLHGAVECNSYKHCCGATRL